MKKIISFFIVTLLGNCYLHGRILIIRNITPFPISVYQDDAQQPNVDLTHTAPEMIVGQHGRKVGKNQFKQESEGMLKWVDITDEAFTLVAQGPRNTTRFNISASSGNMCVRVMNTNEGIKAEEC